jgi:hypothetical protein
METPIVLLVVAVALVAIVWGAVMLTKRSPARLSEEDPRLADGDVLAPDEDWQRGARKDDVMDRPAGPGAEAMGVEPGGKTTSITDRGAANPRPEPRA